MNSSYLLYQAERVKTARQQRDEDIRTGELAADLGRLWNALAHPGHSGGHRGFRSAPEIEMLTDANATCCGQRAA